KVNFARMADRLVAGRAIFIGSGDKALVVVYVTDVVEGLLVGATQEPSLCPAYKLSNGHALTPQKVWRAIAEEIGTAPPRLHLPYRPLRALAYLSELVVNPNDPRRQPLITRLGVELFGTDNRVSIDKARRELGYAPRVSLRKGVHLAAS